MASFRYLDDSINKFKLLQKSIKSGFEITRNFSEDVEENEEGRQMIEQLRDMMVDYASMERDIKNYQQAAEYSRETYERQLTEERDDRPDLPSMFTDKLTSLTSKNNADDLLKHKAVRGFTQTVWEQHFGDNTQAETNDGEGDDEGSQDIEIQMTQTDDTHKFICPITKTELNDPVKNTGCGHNYSRVAIETHIRNNKQQKAKCPVAGCVHFVTIDDLEDNAVLAFELRKKHK